MVERKTGSRLSYLIKPCVMPPCIAPGTACPCDDRCAGCADVFSTFHSTQIKNPPKRVRCLPCNSTPSTASGGRLPRMLRAGARPFCTRFSQRTFRAYSPTFSAQAASYALAERVRLALLHSAITLHRATHFIHSHRTLERPSPYGFRQRFILSFL